MNVRNGYVRKLRERVLSGYVLQFAGEEIYWDYQWYIILVSGIKEKEGIYASLLLRIHWVLCQWFCLGWVPSFHGMISDLI